MAKLLDIISSRSDWLVDQSIACAKDTNYPKNSSPEPACRNFLTEVFDSLVAFINSASEPASAGEQTHNSCRLNSEFQRSQSHKLLGYGLGLEMVIPLLKLSKQSCLDLVVQAKYQQDSEIEYILLVSKFFDSIEIGYCTVWSETNRAQLALLQAPEIEKATRMAYEELNQIFNTASDGMRVIDKNGNLLRINQPLLDLVGQTEEQAFAKKCYELFESPHCHTPNCTLTRIKNGEQRVEYEVEKTSPDGKKIPCILTATSLRGLDGELIGIVENFKDISERKQNEETVKYLAYHDSLTQLPNRMHFQESLQAALKSNPDQLQGVVIMFLDLDGFKAVNDSLGHGTGDKVLQLVAKRLKKCIRQEDLVARMGGDEFTLLFPGVQQVIDIEKIAQKVQNVFEAPYTVKGGTFQISASIGIARYPEDGESPEELLHKADFAMYKAKEQGKNRYVFYHLCCVR